MHALSRRTFFQGAALALSATRVHGANDRINVGLVGIGGRGTAHLNSYTKIQDAQITGLCDVNQAARERAQTRLTNAGATKAKEYANMRELFADKNVDAVSIATPNHWHALASIWACEAGKDVYVEKPASYNVHEGLRMTEVARKTNRMVQVGSQSRSLPHVIRAMQLLNEGVIGPVYAAKGLCFKRRKSIGKTPVEPVPAGVDWDQFLGPAPMRPYTKNRFAYNWHWFWDTGNGDLGNQGVHQMDIARWGLSVGMPQSVVSTGGKYVYDDDQETPNTQLATYDYGGKEIIFEVRGLPSGPEAGVPVKGGNTVGNLFLGGDGWMWCDGGGFRVHKGDSSEMTMEEKSTIEGDSTVLHMKNFLDACRNRDYRKLNADIDIGATSAALCHLANISYRMGHKLTWDQAKSKFVKDGAADALLTREYRKPYVV